MTWIKWDEYVNASKCHRKILIPNVYWDTIKSTAVGRLAFWYSQIHKITFNPEGWKFPRSLGSRAKLNCKKSKMMEKSWGWQNYQRRQLMWHQGHWRERHTWTDRWYGPQGCVGPSAVTGPTLPLSVDQEADSSQDHSWVDQGETHALRVGPGPAKNVKIRWSPSRICTREGDYTWSLLGFRIERLP